MNAGQAVAEKNAVIAEQYKAINGRTWKFVTVMITACTALAGATYALVHSDSG